MKTCTKCGQAKPEDEFYRVKGRLLARCKPCTIADSRAWEVRNYDKLRPIKAARAKNSAYKSKRNEYMKKHPEMRKAARIKRVYGLTQLDVRRMREDQLGGCAICHRELRPVMEHVDHDHKTGRVRGLLCGRCNLGLGHFLDDPGLLLSAMTYLKRG